jgi:Alanyl-tRNA synthetase
MLTKDNLIKEFAKEPTKYYSVKLFQKEGFERKQCKECGMHFWSADSSRELCGDSSHEPYSFIKKKASNIGYEQMWEKLSNFFKENGHSVIDRYPVVSRWRPDLYFTIASIQDFQRIENGKMSFEYGENP